MVLILTTTPDLLTQGEGVLTTVTLGAKHLVVVLSAVQLTKLLIAGTLQILVTDVTGETGLVEEHGADLDQGGV